MKFNLDVMRNVVSHYASERLQDVGCSECSFLPFDDEDSEVPEGYEPVRGHYLLVKQCATHDKPLRPWLIEADPEKAAAWLVEQSEGKKVLQADFVAWEKALSAPA